MDDISSASGNPPIVLDIASPVHGPVFLIAEKDDSMAVRLQIVQQSGAILDPGGPHLISKDVMFVEVVGLHLQVTVDGPGDSGVADFVLFGKDAHRGGRCGPDERFRPARTWG